MTDTLIANAKLDKGGTQTEILLTVKSFCCQQFSVPWYSSTVYSKVMQCWDDCPSDNHWVCGSECPFAHAGCFWTSTTPTSSLSLGKWLKVSCVVRLCLGSLNSGQSYSRRSVPCRCHFSCLAQDAMVLEIVALPNYWSPNHTLQNQRFFRHNDFNFNFEAILSAKLLFCIRVSWSERQTAFKVGRSEFSKAA